MSTRTIALIYLVIVGTLYILFWRRSPEKTLRAATTARRSLVKLFPLLISIFILAGLFEAFFPPEVIESHLGADAGFIALLTGGAIGAVAIGPPVAAFPVAGSLLAQGAWAPAVAAFIVSWMLVGVISIPFEAEIFGMRFALLRNLFAFGAALLIGLAIGAVIG